MGLLKFLKGDAEHVSCIVKDVKVMNGNFSDDISVLLKVDLDGQEVVLSDPCMFVDEVNNDSEGEFKKDMEVSQVQSLYYHEFKSWIDSHKSDIIGGYMVLDKKEVEYHLSSIQEVKGIGYDDCLFLSIFADYMNVSKDGYTYRIGDMEVTGHGIVCYDIVS
jgi:hypothetical protein